jgi:Restriction endonuclease S subunits
MSSQDRFLVSDLIAHSLLHVEDGNHGEYRPLRHEFVTHGTAFIRAADLGPYGIDFDRAEKINDTALRRIRKGIGAPQDVVLSHKGTVGKVAFAPRDAPPFVCSPQTTIWRSLDHSAISPRYLYYALQSVDFQRQLTAMQSSTDMAPYVSLTQQRSLTLILPPPSHQIAIAEVLGGVDDKIAANEHLAKTALALASAIYLQALEPSSQEVPLHEVADILMGSSPPGETYNEVGLGLPFYQGVRDFGLRYPKPRVWCSSPVRVAHPNDSLVSVRAPVGNVNVANDVCCIGRGVAAVRSTKGKPHTLYHALLAARAAFVPYESEGTVFGAINKEQLRSIRVRWPRQDVDTIEMTLASLDSRADAALKESDALAQVRDTLLPRLMSGEIRVREAEKVVEEVL